ncbi:MAG TPA: hypothetical protein DD708_00230 [Deltaproteobacteria bacterium]|nr:hypothetical protein [Deltaproteobacteria bacterium]
MTMGWVTVAKKNELSEGQTKAFVVEGKDIAIAQVKGNYYAFFNECSHAQFPIDQGTLSDTVIECPHHGATFDITTGEALTLPAVTPLKIFKVKVDGEEIKICFED